MSNKHRTMAGKADVFYLCVVCMLSSASGKYIQGETNTLQGWLFLDSFNFDTNKANFQYKVSYPRNYAPMRLLFYREDQFLRANDPGKTCKERLEYLLSTADNSQVRNLDSSQPNSGCYNRYNAEKGDMVYCSGDIYITSDSAGRWYVVANRCGSQNGITGMVFQYYIDNFFDNSLFPLISGQSGITASLYNLLLLAIVIRYFA